MKTHNDLTLKQHICERLKSARISRGYKTAKSFALKHGLKISTYSLHEAGTREMSFEVLGTYCELLGLPPSWLLLGQAVTDHSNTQTIPILAWDEILLFPDQLDLTAKQWTAPDPDLPPPSFAVLVQDDSMEPRYPLETLILVDLYQPPTDREFGLFAKDQNIIFGQLIKKQGICYIRSLKKENILHKITPSIRALGKVVQAKFKPYDHGV